MRWKLLCLMSGMLSLTGGTVFGQESSKATAAATNQELPKIMYVVPWKKLDESGVDETGRPQSLILGLDTNVIDPLQHKRQVHFERLWRSANPQSANK